MATKHGVKSESKIDCSLLTKMNNQELESFFVTYDDLADELIFKFTQPKNPTAYYFLKDNVAVIIDIVKQQVVGIAFQNFKVDFLSKEDFEKWENLLQPELTRKYVKVSPPEKEDKYLPVFENFVHTLGSEKLERCFA